MERSALKKATLAPATPQQSARRAPNVLMAVIDDISQRELPGLYGHLWGYGTEPVPPLPVIQAIADSGTVLERVQSSANCSPTRVSLQTGRYPHRFHIGDIIKGNEPGVPILPDSVPETYRAAGYRTACFGKWHLSTPMDGPGWAHPLQHGWDDYLAGTHGGNFTGTSYEDWVRNDNGNQSSETQYATLAQAEEAADWIGGESGPWYVQCNLVGPHKPIHVPPATLLPPGYPTPVSDREQYVAAIVALDTCLETLMAAVDIEETIVVLLGDNGTPADMKHPLQDAQKVKKSLYREGVEIPCVVAGPSPGWGLLKQVSLDIPSLVRELAAGVLGASNIPTMWDFAPASYGYSERFTPNGQGPHAERIQAVRKDHWRLMRKDGVDSVYELISDPFESNPLPVSALPEGVDLVAVMELLEN